MPDDFSRRMNPKITYWREGSRAACGESLAASYLVSVIASIFFIGSGSLIVSAQQIKKPFTVADEIGLTVFSDSRGGQPEVLFSPDGNFVAVWTERGRLDLNKVEDSLRFYRSQDLEHFLVHVRKYQSPSPVWFVTRLYKEARIIDRWCWLADSSGVVFLEQEESGNRRLVLADLRREKIDPLTSEREQVEDFDVRDRRHYVYAVTDSSEQKKWQTELGKPELIGTGHSLNELLFPNDPVTRRVSGAPAYKSRTLWAVIDRKRFQVNNESVPLAFIEDLALSPDGQYVLAKLPVVDVPSSWERLYPPPYTSIARHVHAGHQDPQSSSAHQYVKINLRTGSTTSLTDAPTAADAGWWLFGSPSWSNDGQEVVLPGSFIKAKNKQPSRPCVVVVDLPSNTAACVEMAKGRSENGDVERGYHVVSNATFMHGDRQRVTVKYRNHYTSTPESIEYQYAKDGTWQVADQPNAQWEIGHDGLEVMVKQGLNESPRLVATFKQTSKVIWDPNPQLQDIELSGATVYAWKDKNGHEWKGGLYKPVEYKPGLVYPLVIQTHGFAESEFRPSGVFPTAYAARALAAQGIIVLQLATADPCSFVTPDEGTCEASSYEAAVEQLVSDGLIDPEKVGIIGFSRTCFHVMEMLTTNSLHVKAASITDGVMENYLQYMLFPDRFPTEANSIIGAQPFGEGLQTWLKRSPGFNLDKIHTPLLVVGEGPSSLLLMWEAYAGLHLLHKPVELVMLNTREHVLTNPSVRMASQGSSVDWFRFWLQNYEDPNPAKNEQYARWRELRKLQTESGQSQ